MIIDSGKTRFMASQMLQKCGDFRDTKEFPKYKTGRQRIVDQLQKEIQTSKGQSQKHNEKTYVRCIYQKLNRIQRCR